MLYLSLICWLLFGDFLFTNIEIFFRERITHQTSSTPELRNLNKKIELEDPAALAQLAQAYEDGRMGLTRDYCAALYWYDRAARKGSSLGEYKLFAAYHAGEGLKEDQELAYFWLTALLKSDSLVGIYPPFEQTKLEKMKTEIAARLTEEKIAALSIKRPADMLPVELVDYIYPGEFSFLSRLITNADTCRR